MGEAADQASEFGKAQRHEAGGSVSAFPALTSVMHHNPARSPARAIHRFAHGIFRWAARRRRVAIGHLLRGACYGIGAGTISLLTFWVQHRGW